MKLITLKQQKPLYSGREKAAFVFFIKRASYRRTENCLVTLLSPDITVRK